MEILKRGAFMPANKKMNAIEIIVGYDPFPSESDMLREGTLKGLVVEASKQQQALTKVSKALSEADDVFKAINRAMKELGTNEFNLQEDFQAILDASNNMGGFWSRLFSMGGKKNPKKVVKEAAGLALALEGLRKTIVAVLELGNEADRESVQRQIDILTTSLKGAGINPEKDYVMVGSDALKQKFGTDGSPDPQSILKIIENPANASKIQKALSILGSARVNTSGVSAPTLTTATAGRGGSIEVGGGYGFTGIGGGSGRGGNYEPGTRIGGSGGGSGGGYRGGGRSQPSQFNLDAGSLKARLVDRAEIDPEKVDDFVEEIIDIVDNAFDAQTGREENKLDFRLVESAMRTGKLTEALFPSEQQLLAESSAVQRMLTASGRAAAVALVAGAVAAVIAPPLTPVIAAATTAAGVTIEAATVAAAIRFVLSAAINEAIDRREDIGDYVSNLSVKIEDKWDKIWERIRDSKSELASYSVTWTEVESVVAPKIAEAQNQVNEEAQARLPSKVTVQITIGSNATKLSNFMSSSLGINEPAEHERVLTLVQRNLKHQARSQGLSRRLKIESASREIDQDLYPEARWLQLAGLITEE